MKRARPRPLLRRLDGSIETLLPVARRSSADALWRFELDSPPTAGEWLARWRRGPAGRASRRCPPRHWIVPQGTYAGLLRDPHRLP